MSLGARRLVGRWHRVTLSTIVFVALLMVLPGIGAMPVGATPASHAGGVSVSILRLGARPMGPLAPPRLPHAVTGPASDGGLVINPTAGYTAEPAPMGIADLGISSSNVAYTYSSTAFLGTFAWNSEAIGSSGSQFTVQLNVVLKFVSGGTTYSYWIQDVALPTNNGGNSLGMSYEDNVWNFSTTGYAMPSTTLTGNGTVANSGGYQWYYDVATGVPGDADTLAAPSEFQLLVTSYLAAGGHPGVSFQYKDPSMASFMTYDNVVFFAGGVTNDPGFTVDGTQYVPAGSPLMWSAEMDLGGPGGGSSVPVNSLTNAHMNIFRFNGDNYQSTPGAWNFGGDTGETSSNVQSIWTWDRDGTLATTQLNGTTRDAAPGVAYNPTQVGAVNASASCSISQGYVASGATRWHFNGTWANLTLYPGSYHMWMNDTTASDDLGVITVAAGGYLPVSASSICGVSTPSVTTPLGNRTSADVGQFVGFSTTASGGTGTYPTYTWTESSTALGCGLANAASISCTPTVAGNFTVSVNVTDSGGSKSTTVTSANFQVFSTPLVTVPSPTRSSVEVGQSVTFSTTASGGTGTYSTYTWTPANSTFGCSLANAASITCTPTAPGTAYWVRVSVTDSNGGGSPLAVLPSYTVVSGPVVTAPIPSTPTGSVGAAVTFSTTASGGSGVYAYTWTASSTSLGCTLSSSSGISCTPTLAGSYTVSVSVNDSFGGTSATQTSAPFTVSNVSAPTVTVPTPSPATVDVGGTVTFSTVAGGGTGTYSTYTWTQSSSGLGCTLANAAAITCVTTAPGNYTVSVAVTDSGGTTSASVTSASFPVNSLPAVTVPTPSPAQVEVGQSVAFTAVASGGTGGYTFLWTASSAGLGCTGSSTGTLSCGPTLSGTYTVSVQVKDSANGLSPTSTSAAFTVLSLPSVTQPTPSASPVNVGQTLTFSTTASGGSGVYAYTWTASSTSLGCTLSSSSGISCTPAAAGTYTVSVSVTDTLGGVSGTATSAPLTVKTPSSTPQPPVISTFTASPSSIPLGGTTFLNVSVTGGTSPYTYVYSTLPPGCTTASTVSLACTPTQAGSFTVQVNVTDSAGRSALKTVSFQVTTSGTSGNPTSNGDLYLLLLIAFIVVIAAIAVALAMRRRKPEPSAVTPWQTQAMYGNAPPWNPPPSSAPPPPPPPPPGPGPSSDTRTATPVGDGESFTSPPESG